MTQKIPKEVIVISDKLIANGYQAYLVGGCVRDLLMGREPDDWDITTDAKPDEIQKIFPESVYENKFGTVLVKLGPQIDADQNADKRGYLRESAFYPRVSAPQVVEVTTFRLEGKYTDKRHPDEIKFAKTIEEDLARRDFTINAMALELGTSNKELVTRKIIDPYNGQEDLEKKLIRAVGNPEERFNEDALRLMRAVRFSAQLDFSAKGARLPPACRQGRDGQGPASGWEIDRKTEEAIKNKTGLLEFISKERIRDELQKTFMADGAVSGIRKMQELGLLKYVMPELEEGVGVGQNKHHIYTVFEHNLKSFEYAVEKNFPFDVRLSSLLHDVGKPRVKQGEGPDCTFYAHQVVGEKMVLRLLDRLRFPRDLIEKVALLVREHMFVYDPETVTLAGVRRLVKRAGPENMEDLLKLREADRIGSGVPKAQPYRLRYLKAMIEKVQQDPIHPKMLKIKGDAVMEILKIEPGPKVGKVLAILLDEVLENPELNNDTTLMKRVTELGQLPEKELENLAEQAKKKAEKAQERIDEEIKKKYFVK